MPNEPVRHLRLAINSRDGEVLSESDECPDCIDKDLALTRLTRSFQGTIRSLRNELEKLQIEDPGSNQVGAVLEHWATRVVEEGWWKRKPAYKPGHPRWTVVGARLKEPQYDVEYCKAVVEGALLQSRWTCSSCGTIKPKREWLDALSLFKEGNLERHYERANDEHLERVRALRQLPPELQDADLVFLTQRCDCGHLRMEHSKPDPWHEHRTPCLMDCWCDDFVDFEQRIEKLESNGHRSHSTLMKTKEQQQLVDTLFDAGEPCKSP